MDGDADREFARVAGEYLDYQAERNPVLATRLGYKAVEMIRDGQFAMMSSLRGEKIEAVPIEDAVKVLKTVPESYFDVAKTFFG